VEVTVARINIQAEIAGTVWKIEAKIGSAVTEDDEIIILESMKMEIPVYPPMAGVLMQILVKEGEPVQEGQTLAVIEC
jgi:acetyl-CoA carboxylase biotin carboxyl carrier protein